MASIRLNIKSGLVRAIAKEIKDYTVTELMELEKVLRLELKGRSEELKIYENENRASTMDRIIKKLEIGKTYTFIYKGEKCRGELRIIHSNQTQSSRGNKVIVRFLDSDSKELLKKLKYRNLAIFPNKIIL